MYPDVLKMCAYTYNAPSGTPSITLSCHYSLLPIAFQKPSRADLVKSEKVKIDKFQQKLVDFCEWVIKRYLSEFSYGLELLWIIDP